MGDLILTFGKIAGILLTGIAAIVGILYEIKGPDGSVTRWGWCLISCAVLFAGISLICILMEEAKGKASAKAESERTQRLLASIDETTKRSGQVLDEVARSREEVVFSEITCDVSLLFSLDDPIFEAYEQRLKTEFAELKERCQTRDGWAHSMSGLKARLWPPPFGGQRPSYMSMSAESCLLPNPNLDEEKYAAVTVSILMTEVEFTNARCRGEHDAVEILLGGAIFSVTDDTKSAPQNSGKELLLPKSTVDYWPERRKLQVNYKSVREMGQAKPSDAFLSVVDFEQSTARVYWANVADAVGECDSLPPELLRFGVSFGPNRRELFCAPGPYKPQLDEASKEYVFTVKFGESARQAPAKVSQNRSPH